MPGLPSCSVACCAVSLACLLVTTYVDLSAAAFSSTKITFDLDKGHAVTETLWGIFFEEVGLQLIRHACESRCDLTAHLASTGNILSTELDLCTLALQIQHAGDGGLYAEMIQDRQFGGLAFSLGLFHTSTMQLQVPAAYHQADYLPLASVVQQQSSSVAETNLTGVRRWRQDHGPPEYR